MFLDTSIVIAYYLPETYSQQAQTYYNQNFRPVISNFVALETASVFSRLVRTNSITIEIARQVSETFLKHMDEGIYTLLNLQSEHFRYAHNTIVRFDLPLKAPDALHLAAAALEGLPLITADRQLARNARALGVQVGLIEA